MIWTMKNDKFTNFLINYFAFDDCYNLLRASLAITMKTNLQRRVNSISHLSHHTKFR